MSWPHDRRWSALPVVDLRWAYAHAGLRLARMARADEAQRGTPHALSVDEAVDLGCALALLLEKRALPPEYLEIFQLPALLRYRYHFPDAAYPEEELRTRAGTFHPRCGCRDAGQRSRTSIWYGAGRLAQPPPAGARRHCQPLSRAGPRRRGEGVTGRYGKLPQRPRPLALFLPAAGRTGFAATARYRRAF